MYKTLKMDFEKKEIFTGPDDLYFLNDTYIYEAGKEGVELGDRFTLRLNDGWIFVALGKNEDGYFYIKQYVEPKTPVEKLVDGFNALDASDQLEFALKILKACKDSTVRQKLPHS